MKEYKSICLQQSQDGESFDVSELEYLPEYENNCCTCTVCAQCGYRFYESDDIVKVKQTGDVVHRDCFNDYADDSIDELCDVLYL